MSSFVIAVCLGYIGFVLSRHFTTKISRKCRLFYNVSVPCPKPGLAENRGKAELGAAPFIPCSQLGLVWGMAN